MQSKLSIIVPIFNVEKYLPKCLDSILNQTFEDFEVICIDDGSTDSSLEILTEHSQEDRRVKIISQKNKGPSVARNNGLKVASGEYICFVDGDDWIEPNTLELVIENFKDDIDIVCYGANIVTDGNVDMNKVQNAKIYQEIKYFGEVCLNDHLIANMTVNIWNKIFRKSIIKQNQILFPEGIIHEDNAFFHKYILLCKKAYFINEYLYNYTQREVSLTTEETNINQNYKALDRMCAFYDIYVFLKNKDITNKHIDLLMYLFQLFLFFDYNYCKETDKNILLNKASEIANAMNEKELTNNGFLNTLRAKDYSKVTDYFKQFRYNF